MRYSRPLCFLLVFLISFSFLVVSASAATNLINPNLKEWVSPNPDAVMSVSVIGDGSLYRLSPAYQGTIESTNASVYLGYMLDRADLKSGNSYTFSFHLPSPDEIRACGYSNSDSWFASQFTEGGFLIAFGTLNPNGEVEAIVELVTIDSSNFLSLAGKDYVHSFTCPDYSGGDPCIVMYSSRVYSTSYIFLDGSLKLVNNSEEDNEGFLSSIFEWFEKKFNAIGIDFDNLGSSITSALNGLGERIKGFFNDLSEGFENAINGLLAGIGGEFQKFGNLFLYFTYSDVVPENPFEAVGGPLDLVEGYFDDMIEYLRNVRHNLTDVVDSVSSGVYLFDVFTERFPWVKALCVFALAIIVISRFIGL